MKTVRCIFTALAFVLAFTSVRAADITPAETKTIAEEGFIYGLPIVMNYGVMYEYAVDKNSSQFKAPFNQIKNEARVFYIQGHSRWSRRTATRRIPSPGWTCVPNRLSYRSQR